MTENHLYGCFRSGVSNFFPKRPRFGEVKMCGGRPFSLTFFEPLTLNANELFNEIFTANGKLFISSHRTQINLNKYLPKSLLPFILENYIK